MNLEAKLSAPRLSPTEIADILERHLAGSAEETRYAEACAVLRRMNRHGGNVCLRQALRVLERETDPRAALRKALAALRSWRHLSGA